MAARTATTVSPAPSTVSATRATGSMWVEKPICLKTHFKSYVSSGACSYESHGEKLKCSRGPREVSSSLGALFTCLLLPGLVKIADIQYS